MQRLKGPDVLAGSRSFLVRVLSVLAVAGTFAACKDSTAPASPASVSPDATTIADATAGAVVTPSPGFTVKDAGGGVLGGVDITITVTAGGGTLTGAPTKTQGGSPTSVGQWKLGNTAGVNSLTVTAGGLPPLVISINGKAGPPASLVFVAGSNQSAPAGTVVTEPVVAQVRDQFNNGVSGIAVSFSILDGDGAVSDASVATDAAGNATAPPWRLGRSAVTQSLRASVPGGLTATAFAAVASGYTVDVRFFGPQPTAAAAAAFTAAAARIRASVTGDVVNVATPPGGIDISGCGVPGVTLNEVVDDVIIYATIVSIDGPGAVLGSAGPCFVRSVGRQTLIGVMRFDSDDIQGMIDRGELRDVIQHEMLHVIGIGTLWDDYAILLGAGTAQSRFVGVLGVGACITLGGAAVCPGSVPVEDKGGPGSIDGHWREAVFGTELMTSRIGGSNNPLSILSIQSLADVGYSVNLSAADPYVIPGQSAIRGLDATGDPAPLWETLIKPKFEITPSGKITPLERR